MDAKTAPLDAKVTEGIGAMKTDGTRAGIHETWTGTKPEDGLATVTILDMPKL